MIERNAAVPIVPPIWRKKVTEDVATPISRGDTAFCTARITGCDAPSHWCDVHHVLHWSEGGHTSLDNSALLCERHHTKVHHGFRIERQPDGRWRTWRPDGTEILLPDALPAPR